MVPLTLLFCVLDNLADVIMYSYVGWSYLAENKRSFTFLFLNDIKGGLLQGGYVSIVMCICGSKLEQFILHSLKVHSLNILRTIRCP